MKKSILLVIAILMMTFGITTNVYATSEQSTLTPTYCRVDNTNFTCTSANLGIDIWSIRHNSSNNYFKFNYNAIGKPQYNYILFNVRVSPAIFQRNEDNELIPSGVTATFANMPCQTISQESGNAWGVMCPYMNSGELVIAFSNGIQINSQYYIGVGKVVSFFEKSDYTLQQILNSINTQNNNINSINTNIQNQSTTQHNDSTTINNNITNLNDNILDSSLNSSTSSNASNIGSNDIDSGSKNVILDFMLMPITFIQNLLNSFDNTCATLCIGNCGSGHDNDWRFIFPCIDLQSILGTTVYNLIDLLMTFGMVFAFVRSVVGFLKKALLLENDVSSEVRIF